VPEVTDHGRGRGLSLAFGSARSLGMYPAWVAMTTASSWVCAPSFQDVLDVPAGGVTAHHQPLGDGLRVESLPHQGKDLPLAGS